MSVFPFKILESAGQTKLQQLVHSITEAISNGKLKSGDMLPSVNQLSAESGFSRDTVFKAYNILKERNIIESAPQKGYFVTNETYKVFMLLDDFSAFKEELYQSFRQNLPESYSVDLMFHHYNQEVFQQLIQSSLGRYNSYIVMNIRHNSVDPILEKIDPNKLLVLDMGNADEGKLNYLLQDFNNSLLECLEEGKHKIKKYRELILVYSKINTPHPLEIVDAVRTFCDKNQIGFKQTDSVKKIEVKKEQLYFVIRDADLVEVIKNCRKTNLKLGSDVGILSYNDTPMKQVVGGGITVVSTDFEAMGQMAADFVKSKRKISRILPTSLILRESL